MRRRLEREFIYRRTAERLCGVQRGESTQPCRTRFEPGPRAPGIPRTSAAEHLFLGGAGEHSLVAILAARCTMSDNAELGIAARSGEDAYDEDRLEYAEATVLWVDEVMDALGVEEAARARLNGRTALHRAPARCLP